MGYTAPPGDPTPPDSADDCVPPEKRTKSNVQHHAQNIDRISSLPNDILNSIVSLVTVREAAMTDLLSARWRHLWENIENLIFDTDALGMQLPANLDEHAWNSEAEKFVNKVNAVLSRHNGNGIKKFVVKFPLSSTHASNLDRWVQFASASGLEKLSLILSDAHRIVPRLQAESYVFPLKYFADVEGYQLSALSLFSCMLETAPVNLNGFSHLESLSLRKVEVVDEVVMSVMSSCPALRQLYLGKCCKLRNLRIAHAQLVIMEVYRCQRRLRISIHAEKLKTFSYTGSSNTVIEHEYAPVLCELNALFVEGTWSPLGCSDAFHKLKTLRLQFPFRSQVSRVLQHCGSFTCLREMMLCILTSWKKSIRFVAYLVKDAPLLERLVLKIHGYLRPPRNLKIRWPKNFMPEIRIQGFSGESELTQLVFLLLRSPVLEMLLIDTRQYRRRWHWKESEDAKRRSYAREVVSRHLAPNVPSNVKFNFM